MVPAVRLSLLLEQGDEALGYYARGISHCLTGVYSVPAGGSLRVVEYRSLGAFVGIVAGTGGAAEKLLADPLWSSLPNLY
jgi:hypothetical protein